MVDNTFDPNGGRAMTYTTPVPATMTATGKKGETVSDGTYLYICIATNTWRRITLETF